MKQQRGGTILGFIIGMVVGLGVALGVAVYVTKVPVPFLNKGQSRGPEQDAAEAKKNKDWDPNAPLYGKNPAKPAAAPAAAASAPAAAKAETKVEGKTEAKPAVTADPLGDLAKAKTAADPFAYFVQAGAFRTAEDAESQRAKLSLAGVEAKVSEREQSGRMVYRVRVGPFDKRDEAERTKDKLDGAGYETALVRVQR
ncbi:MAG: SPOR domain-containing protein [Pseudomonadota bacterium]|jgi:cell division protein FtsN|uniref:SPOR domain-containing protein n=1 Tax=Curvibacter delicatus TaxID=80879 RepID=UPI00082BDBCF|nr:SPOR domain-containing protein [Curvibacter delicatus]MEA3395646.1 SPOR domain-containing protein [Pseudomonadota bacterium]